MLLDSIISAYFSELIRVKDLFQLLRDSPAWSARYTSRVRTWSEFVQTVDGFFQ